MKQQHRTFSGADAITVSLAMLAIIVILLGVCYDVGVLRLLPERAASFIDAILLGIILLQAKQKHAAQVQKFGVWLPWVCMAVGTIGLLAYVAGLL